MTISIIYLQKSLLELGTYPCTQTKNSWSKEIYKIDIVITSAYEHLENL